MSENPDNNLQSTNSLTVNKERARIALNGLIQRYHDNLKDKEFARNESQIINSLIRPFVEHVLLWDTEKPSEYKVESQIQGKRIDISVCSNGVTQFIIEAKSLTAEIVNNNDFYKQAMTYAYGKERTFAILTNFKYFVILRCDVQIEPWKAAVKVIDIENLKDEDFDSLYCFSKKFWLDKGDENPLYLKLKDYKKREKIDLRLLGDLKEWRQSILNNILNHPKQNKYDFSNEKLKYEIEEEVQRFIDRLIFVSFTEDKGFHDPQLKSLIEEKKDKHSESLSWLLNKILELFNLYWQKYNSDLFKHGKCDEFFIEDLVLYNILIGLRKPKERLPYDFASIEADILGKTYENFIGHIISGEKRLKETQSKGKRKEMGIYYTPTYIVDYIVRNTVGEYIKGKAFSNINKVKILDPACGSGSFLIKAFDVLLEESRTALGREPNYEEKKSLMLNCIHGVDLDERAVDICKLNLSLKLAEMGQKLPELHNNIKCGNSLIDDETVAGYKAFKWENEFKEIMQNGGFDVVVGNPPYFKIFEDNPINKTKDYLEIKSGMMNIAAVFINRFLKQLKSEGNLGMIIPKMLAFTDSWDKLRKRILKEYTLVKVVDCGKAFKDVLLEQIIIVIHNDKSMGQITVGEISKNEILEKTKIPQQLYFNENSIYLESNPVAYKIKDKMENSKVKLGNISEITLGLGIQSMESFKATFKHGYEKVLRGDDIQRYQIRSCKFYDPNDKKLNDYKNTIQKFKIPHIVTQRIVAHIRDHIKITATIDEEGLFSFNTVTNIFLSDKKYDLKFILAVLNSSPTQYYTYKFIYQNAIRSMDFYKAYAQRIPIPKFDEKQNKIIIKLCDKMLSLNKKLHEESLSQTEKQKLEEEIKRTYKEIDELFYQLYGITEEEKKIIEESLK